MKYRFITWKIAREKTVHCTRISDIRSSSAAPPFKNLVALSYIYIPTRADLR